MKYLASKNNIRKELEQFFDTSVEVYDKDSNDNYEIFTVKIAKTRADMLSKYCRQNHISYEILDSDEILISQKINIETLNNLCNQIKTIYKCDEFVISSKESSILISWYVIPF